MINESYFWLNIFLLAIGTLAIRGFFIAFSAHMKVSDRLTEMLSFIPAAILPAFIAPAVFFHRGQSDWLFERERLIILIFAAVACYFVRSTFVTIAFGMVALYLVTQVMI